MSDPFLHCNYVKMAKEEFDILLEKVSPLIEKTYWTRKPISSAERLAVTLRFLAAGDSMASVVYSFRNSVSGISIIIREVCNAIWTVLLHPNKEQWEKIDNFEQKWNLLHCMGALDGEHIVMQALPNSGSNFYNYKGQHSIVLIALAYANYCFTYVEVGFQGRQSDGGKFRNSVLFKKTNNKILDIPNGQPFNGIDGEIPYFIVGDEAFPLIDNLMRLFPGRSLPQKYRVFNYRLSRARRVIENAFGILASRWRILRKPIIASV